MKYSILLILLFQFLSPGLFAQNGTWETGLAPVPVEKWAQSSCVVNGKIYVMGGLVLTDLNIYNSVGSSSIEVYDPATNTWDMSRAPMPTERGYCAVGAIGSKIYVCGGSRYNPFTQMAMLEIYDTETDTWDTSKPPMPTGRFETRGAVLDGKFYVIGGLDSNNPLLGKSFEVFDPATESWTKLPDIPQSVGSMNVDTLFGKIYLTGGIPKLKEPTKLIQVYNPALNQWEVLDLQLPFVSSHTGSCTVGNLIYLFGHGGTFTSETTAEAFPDVFLFDPTLKVINKVTTMPRALGGPSVHYIDGKVYVSAGWDPKISMIHWVGGLLTDVYAYTPVHNPIYTYDFSLSSNYVNKENGKLSIQTRAGNFTDQDVTINVRMTGLDVDFEDSVQLLDDGNHSDGLAADGLFGNLVTLNIPEGYYVMDAHSMNPSTGISFLTPDVEWFTSVGPVAISDITFLIADTIPNPGDEISFKPVLINKGATAIAGNITAEIYSLDTAMAVLSGNSFSYGHIVPGESNETSTRLRKIIISEDCPDSTLIDFSVDISSNNYVYWRDTFQIKVGYGFVSGIDELVLPISDDILIFPNPTSGILNITGLIQPSDVKIYSAQGQLLKTVHQVESTIDLSGLPAGVYILNLTTGTERVVRNIVIQ